MREILKLLPKPSRYLGIEEGAVIPDIANARLHCALAFPDLYEVGMSYLGQKIIYGHLNSLDGVVAERVFTPDRDGADIMRRYSIPLATLESDTPLAKTHLIGFSITTELAFTNILFMLDLAGIPLRAEARGDDLKRWPLIIAGGGCTICAEPMAPFFDIMTIGESEAMLPQLISLLISARKANLPKSEFLAEARHIPGVYVPSLFSMEPDGSLRPKHPDYTEVKRRALPDLSKAYYPTKQVVPFGAVHNRLSIEIARGCTRGCRFCQAGMTLRPSRERNIDEIHSILEKCLEQTGYDDVSFLSLSCGDFSAMKTLFTKAADRCAQEQISISLPSLRVGSIDGDIMSRLAGIRRTGATLAPEAGTQRLRDVINKGISEEALIHHVRQLIGYGWQQVKLYFMIGLPTETYEDLDGITDICRKVRDCCRYRDESGNVRGQRIAVTASLSPFVPKTHTPFQWEAQLSVDEIKNRIYYVRDQFKKEKALTLRWHEPAMSHLEGIISRGDRRLAPVIESAYRKGGIFSSWIEGFDFEPWRLALLECGQDEEYWTGPRRIDGVLPWDHIVTGVSKRYLLKERERAYGGKVTSDCRYAPCRQCGVCDTKAGPSLLRACDDMDAEPLLTTNLNFSKRDQIDMGPIPRPAEYGSAKSEPPKLDERLISKAVRYRLRHQKTGRASYLSQLEIQSLLERAMRRAALPLAFSQGFHPLPLMTFGMALPVGIESLDEWVAVTLREHISPKDVYERLAPHMPRGLALTRIEELQLTGTVPGAICERYEVKLTPNAEMKMQSRILERCWKDFSDQPRVLYEKTNKKGVVRQMDIRPLLAEWHPMPERGISMLLDWSDAYLSPAAIVSFIVPDLDPVSLSIRKTEQIFAK